MEYPKVLANDYGIRPAGKPDECFYCQSKVGERHGKECVVVEKTVLVKFTFEVPVNVPHSNEPHNIEFKYNEGSWCADNAIDMLKELSDKEGCLCPVTSCEFVRVIDDTPTVKDPLDKP